MYLFTVKAKVNLSSEEDMEVEQMDLGIVAKSSQWVWRDTTVLTEQIYRITAYNSNKSIIQLYDGEKILVAETHESLIKRWEDQCIEIWLDDEMEEQP